MKLSEVTGGSAGFTPADPERDKRMRAFARQKAAGEFDTKYSAASDSGMENFMAGMGAGVVGVGDRAVNLMLPKALERGRFTEEGIAARKAKEADLMATGAGQAGKMVGEIVATAPVGGAVGALGKGAATGLGATRAAQAASKLPGAARVARGAGAALEGSGSALLTSDVGEGGEAALTGGLIGGGMSGATELIGAGVNKIRPKVTDQAKRVMEETGTFIPASQALPEESILRQAYGGIAANIPGQQLRKQYGEAVDAARDTALAGSRGVPSALPHNVPLRSIYDPAAGDTQYDMMKNAKKAWDTAFDGINSATVEGHYVPKSIGDAVRARAGNSIKIPAPGVAMTGREMLDFQQAVNQLARETPTGPLDRAAKTRLQKVANHVDTKMQAQLRGQFDADGIDLADIYSKNKDGWKNWKTIEGAAKNAPGGKFTMRQLERSAAKKGNEPVQRFAEDASEALKKFPSNQGPFQTVAALSLVGGGIGGAMTADPDATLSERLLRGVAGAGATYGGARLLTTPTAQRIAAQYDDEASRKMIERLRKVGRVARRGAAISSNQGE